ncbi:MAG: hypothetical protein IT462_11580 [Planctomycetes bacterium]|nr:hypothetical protein [Planctomycetota bacterium]
MSQLTEAQRRAYVRKGGVSCLHCNSDQIEGGSFSADTGIVTQGIHCLECGHRWTDVYELVAVKED